MSSRKNAPPKALMPFGGWVPNERGIMVPAETGPHVITSGLPGVGKSRRWLAPAVAMWPSSALVSSTRDDIMMMTMRRRPVDGDIQLMDVRPIKSPGYPAAIKQVRFDPTRCIKTFQDAAACARAMLRLSGAGQPGGIKVEAGGMWDDLAFAPLACILWAAASDERMAMEWVLEAAENPWAPMPDEYTGKRNWAEVDPYEPGWAAAADDHYSPPIAFQKRVRGLLCQEPRQRDSVKMTISHALTGWLVTSLSSQETEPLELDFLDNPKNTLYVLCPLGGEAAPVVSVLMEMLISRRREMSAQWGTMCQLGLFMDELTNTPLANLDLILAETRGLGITVCGAMQASSQLTVVYGPDRANAIMDVVGAGLIMYGAHEPRWLDSAVYFMGKATSSTHTLSNHTSERTTGREYREMFDPTELNPPNKEYGRLIVRGTAGTAVYLPDFIESMKHLDDAMSIYGVEPRQLGPT
ncbi:TraM recognition domain-containing protein [Mycobacteroides salmoniphilum]|uniref:type IV secretory system conjugative DNA transfer family protein n=1 Tax=Mycobacteroides salmoniphilum TaxID=404941 RepID=UPI003564AC8E